MFATFVPFASAHARRECVMRTCGLGLLHRMYMDTQPCDVLLLVPALLSYQAELCLAGYPSTFLRNVFQLFLRHAKVARCSSWHELYARFVAAVQCGRDLSSLPKPYRLALGAGCVLSGGLSPP